MSHSVPRATTNRPAAQGNPIIPTARNGGAFAAAAPKSPPAGTAHGRVMPHITLNPTSRVAAVSSAHPPAPTHSPRQSSTCASFTPSSHNAERTINTATTVEAVNAAYEKTAVQLKAIEEKLDKIHEDLRQAAATAPPPPLTPQLSPTVSVPTPLSTSDPHNALAGGAGAAGNTTGKNGFLRVGPVPTTVAAVESANSAGANHHLQPIRKPAEAAHPPRGVAAAAAIAKPARASSPKAVTSPSRTHFSLDESTTVETPEDSGNSNDSDSSDDEATKRDGGSYLPAAAQHSLVKPAKPPPAPAMPVGPSLLSNGTANNKDGGGAVRQGIGFKGLAGGGAHHAGGAGRRAIKINVEEGGGTGAPPPLPFSAAASSATHGDPLEKPGAGEGAHIVAVGRQNRKVSLKKSMRGSCSPDDDSLGVDNAKAVDGLSDVTRRQSHAMKHARERFFAPIPRFSDVLPCTDLGSYEQHDIEKMVLPGATCSWLCCAALAISYTTGIPTTIEKVLKANHMGAHSISLPTVTLAELYDATNDYLHIRFHRNRENNGSCTVDEFDEDEEAKTYLNPEELKQLQNMHCEMATFDTEVLDPSSEDAVSGMGEHPPITSLAMFRKELMQHLSEEKSMYIFSYEPYALEQAQLRLRSNMCDTEEEAAAVMQTARYAPKSVGHFAVLLSFDPVQHTVTLLTPYMSKEQHPMNFPEDTEAEDDGGEGEEEGEATRIHRFSGVFSNLVLEQQTVSLEVLYESVTHKDPFTSLSRGFVRVFHSAEFVPKLPSIFPLFVLDGSSAGGLMTSVLDVKIAPHVLGLAMLHHLSVTFLLSDNARRKQSSRNLLNRANVCDVKLRGIPLTKICQQLRLPLSMIVGVSNKSSIATAYVWYHLFLQQLQIHQDVRIGLILPARRDNADDGQPNITDAEFLNHLRLVVSSQSVMLISFNINVGLNVLVDSRSEPAHFAILIGLDEERGIVRLADVNVKRFRKTWHISISRLYNAIMGYGYIVASKDKKVIKRLNGKEFQDGVLQRAQHFLPPPAPTQYHRFEYPAKPYPVTVLADAVERLGFPGTNVERFLNFSGFHISYFLSFDMPLEGAANVINNYSHYALDDAVSVTTMHYDFYEGNPPPTAEEAKAFAASGSLPSDYKKRTEDDLLHAIQYVLAEPAKRKLIVKYDVDVVASDPAVWNGSSGSSFAFVMSYEAATKTVVLSNADPSSFYRAFACPLSVLFSAVCSWDRNDLRACGTILLTTEVSQESVYENVKGYDMAHALVHHPFKPVFSAACACLALAATEMMMNIEAPTLLGGAPLSFEEDEKRKYKRYNNIFSGEDFLYALPSFSVHDWRTQPVDSQDVVSIANNAFATLKLPLHAVDVLKDDEETRKDPLALLRACRGTSGLLTISLVAYDTGVLHGVPGTSVGLVNRVHVIDEDDDDGNNDAAPRIVVPGAPENSVGSVQLLEGDPCRWGACFECAAEVLSRAIVGVYLVEEVVGGEEE